MRAFENTVHVRGFGSQKNEKRFGFGFLVLSVEKVGVRVYKYPSKKLGVRGFDSFYKKGLG